MSNEIKTVEMSPEEVERYEAFKVADQKKQEEDKIEKELNAYKEMVNSEVESAITILQELSGDISIVKSNVISNFQEALKLKGELLNRVKEGQKSHTFRTQDGKKRVTIGQNYIDAWDDTVEDGISIVKESIMSYVKDPETKALVNQLMRLVAKDQTGNLKANKVIQLEKLAEELKNDRLNEGIKIIKKAHIPSLTKTYIKAEYQDEQGNWVSIPLGMTEA